MKISASFVLGLAGLLLAMSTSATLASETPQTPAAPKDGRTAPLLEGMGSHHYPITTSQSGAQRYFDQGLVLAYGFNHAEAERSFREAARLDPDCAMCFWGAALVLGPNINAGMEDDAVAPAWQASRKALELAAAAGDRLTAREHALIESLAKRYSAEPVEDRAALDQAFSNALIDAALRFPEDPVVITLLAESLMDQHPWDYWAADGTAEPWTGEILRHLERAIELAPDHPGALHLYLHAIEASSEPQRAEAAADRLADLVPGAGHLVHMPSHIYLRVGRYGDAVDANLRAIEADQSYVTQCHAQGLYPLAYMPHNRHFLWAAATLEGRSDLALEAARHISDHADAETMREPGYGTLQHFYATPLYALTRFGHWDEILAAPKPAADLVYPTGVWHYAQGIALVAKSRLDEAQRNLDQLARLAVDPALEEVTIWDINTSTSLLQIAVEVLAGELAAGRGQNRRALRHLRTAVKRQDALNYDEPEAWHYPTRQSLGAVLLEAGQPAKAEEVYREDLRQHPENGWSLFGLARSLEAQDRQAEAEQVTARFRKAWKRADVELSASRF